MSDRWDIPRIGLSHIAVLGGIALLMVGVVGVVAGTPAAEQPVEQGVESHGAAVEEGSAEILSPISKADSKLTDRSIAGIQEGEDDTEESTSITSPTPDDGPYSLVTPLCCDGPQSAATALTPPAVVHGLTATGVR